MTSRQFMDTSDSLQIGVENVFKYFDDKTLQVIAEINQDKKLSSAERSILAEKLFNDLGPERRPWDHEFNRMMNKIVEYKIDQKNKFINSWRPSHFGGVEK